ncbi:MAG TPA: hypothetical protein VFW28_13850 [Micropepsaceae bacterium]|nr:hypothetical protein [Micropepsaceae bacterium]
MRWNVLAGLGMALALAATPADAAWHGYFNKQGVAFSFAAPGELKGEKSTYRSAIAGERAAVVFTSVEDNVEFKITVVDIPGRPGDEAALIKEASAAYRDKAKVLLDEDARIESSYGRKLTIDLPDNRGRAMSAIYFKDNHLIQLQATVLPGGDMQSAYMGRFVDSLSFYESYTADGATELKPPK